MHMLWTKLLFNAFRLFVDLAHSWMSDFKSQNKSLLIARKCYKFSKHFHIYMLQHVCAMHFRLVYVLFPVVNRWFDSYGAVEYAIFSYANCRRGITTTTTPNVNRFAAERKQHPNETNARTLLTRAKRQRQDAHRARTEEKEATTNKQTKKIQN